MLYVLRTIGFGADDWPLNRFDEQNPASTILLYAPEVLFIVVDTVCILLSLRFSSPGQPLSGAPVSKYASFL